MKRLLYQSLAIILLAPLQNVYAVQYQTISSIHTAISQFISTQFIDSKDYDYNLAQLDQRLKLPICPESLQVSTKTGSLTAGRNTISVHCPSKKKWTIFTRAQIRSYKNVLIVKHPIRRGEIISENSLSLKKQDIGKLRQGYLLTPEQVIGKQAKRLLTSGLVINGNHFTEPKLIKRGEKIKIQAKSSNFQISMAGIAMMDGRKGQRIRVKNVNSNRIIQATVVKSGQVSVF